MAVYAGMVDAMDHHIGRLINHIDEIGELDNTVFLFLSDNGAEGSIVTRHQAPDSNAPVAPFQLWMRLANYNTDAQTLGERDSYHDIGPAWASAPVSGSKLYAETVFPSSLTTTIALPLGWNADIRGPHP